MQQADVAAAEALKNLAVGLLLRVVQRAERLGAAQLRVEPPHLALVGFEYPFLHQPVEHGGRHARLLQQHALGHLADGVGLAQYAGQFRVLHQQGQLLGCPPQCVKEPVQPRFVAAPEQPHASLGLGTVGAPQLFFHENRLFVEQRLHHAQQVLQPAVVLQLGDALGRLPRQQVEHPLFPRGEGGGGFVVGVVGHHGLAFYFQPGRDGGLVHLAHRAEIVFGHPLPELELHGQQQGGAVEHRSHLLHHVVDGRVEMDAVHNGGVELLPPEGNHYAASSRHLLGQVVGQAVREVPGQRERQYDIDVSLHLLAKIVQTSGMGKRFFTPQTQADQGKGSAGRRNTACRSALRTPPAQREGAEKRPKPWQKLAEAQEKSCQSCRNSISPA